MKTLHWRRPRVGRMSLSVAAMLCMCAALVLAVPSQAQASSLMGNMQYKAAGVGARIGIGALVILVLLAFVLSIFVYIKFTGVSAVSLKRQWSLNRFLNFDTIILAGVLEYFYILCALEICAVWLGLMFVIILSSSTVSTVVIVFAPLAVAVLIVLCELLCRMGFESAMLMVKLSENSTIIKDAVAGAAATPPASPSTQPAAEGAFGTSAAAPKDAHAPGSQPQSAQASAVSSQHTQAPTAWPQSGSPAARARNDSWTCPACGKSNLHGGSFCGGCGRKRFEQ